MTYCNGGETLRLVIRDFDTATLNVGAIELIRRDYTNDDQGGDMGIINTPISYTSTGDNYTDPSPLYTGDYVWYDFPLNTNPDAYNSEYRVNFEITD